MIKQFRTDPHFLTKYHVKSSLIFLVLAGTLFYARGADWKSLIYFAPTIFLLSYTKIEYVLTGFAWSIGVCLFQGEISWASLLFLPVSVIMCFPFTTWLHNASHGSLRPRWLTRPVGEIAGLVQLSGFPDWKLLHVVHHTHSDDLEKDPHPPMNKTYIQFVREIRTMAVTAFVNYYLDIHGRNAKSARAIKFFARASQVDQLLRVAFWWSLLGPNAFTFLFVSSIVFKMFHYAWFNYSTHPLKPGDSMRDLDHGIYKAINIVGFGLYCHKTHHDAPMVFDPRTLIASKQKLSQTDISAA